jgi:hypothetical protein
MQIVSMKRFACFLLVTMIAWPAAADDSVKSRVAPFRLDDDRGPVAVYDHYRSGKPRLVIAGNGSELLLIRLPDSTEGKGRVLQRIDAEERVTEIEFMRIIDPRDVLVTQLMPHGGGGSVYRVLHQRLIKISDDLPGGEDSKIDIDGDGVPELVWYGYSGHVDDCDANDVYASGIQKWDGRKYVDNGRTYLGGFVVHVGVTERQFKTQKGKHYFLRVYEHAGVRDLRVTIDDTPARRNAEVWLQPDCHELTVHMKGSANAAAYVSVEERP